VHAAVIINVIPIIMWCLHIGLICLTRAVLKLQLELKDRNSLQAECRAISGARLARHNFRSRNLLGTMISNVHIM
jgi:hypothetical protein